MGRLYAIQENESKDLRMYEESLKYFVPQDFLVIEIYSIIAVLQAQRGNWQISSEYVKKTQET